LHPPACGAPIGIEHRWRTVETSAVSSRSGRGFRADLPKTPPRPTLRGLDARQG